MKRNPFAPFATSTLQMDASRKLGFSAKQTMKLAQRLYEGVEIGGEVTGLITYMRTDGVTIIPEAISAIRGLIAREYSQRFVAAVHPRVQDQGQERAGSARGDPPDRRARAVRRTSRAMLDRDQARLYELIWKRTVASQMASAELEQTTADIEVKGRDGKLYVLRASGSVVQFEGFLKVYEEGRDDRVRVVEKGKEDHSEDDDSRRLPALAEGDRVTDRKIEAEQHFTQPPPRYSEATLVKRMEELGIGRPSTYASTLAVLQERDYVRIDKKRLIPEDKGRLVTAFLESFFKRYVEYDFTADLEEKLDLISDGKLEWKDVLRDFWKNFMGAVEEIKDLRVGDVLEALNELLGPHIFPPRAEGGDPRQCPNCGEGRLSLKVSGKFGAFIGCSRYPDCRYTRQLTQPADGPAEASTPDGKLLGHDPETGLAVTLRTGRFGPYVQLGEGHEGGQAEALLHSQRRRCQRRRPRLRAEAAVAAAADRRPSRDGQADHGKPRPLRAVHPARRHLCQPAVGGGSVLGRHQPRRRAAGGEESRRQEPLPARRGDGAQGTRRASERRRQGAGALGALRPLRQARRRQRDTAAGQGAGGADHG